VFTTSTYYADTLPTWVTQFNAHKLPQEYAGKPWTLLLMAPTLAALLDVRPTETLDGVVLKSAIR
jgi:hypothetical protein